MLRLRDVGGCGFEMVRGLEGFRGFGGLGGLRFEGLRLFGVLGFWGVLGVSEMESFQAANRRPTFPMSSRSAFRLLPLTVA